MSTDAGMASSKTSVAQESGLEPNPAALLSDAPSTPKRGLAFWLVFLALGVSTALNALEIAAISTALPTIIHDLGGGSTFIWVGSAYALCATAFVPLSGNLAEILGRRPVMLGSLTLMAAGSAVCGAATSMSMLIGGRVVQGLGGGGIASSTAIIVSDMVPLNERGLFNGLVGIFWSVFTGAGPLIAGGLAQHGQWRWLFYLNIPICGAAASLIFTCLRVPTPPGTAREKLARVDWIGNVLVVAASTAVVIGLTWGGTQYPWSSGRVLTPLILGLVGLVVFLLYEAKIAKHPVVPFELLASRTGVSGYLQTFFMPFVLLSLAYYSPVYFQACKGSSPIHAGVYMLSIACVTAPSGVIAGITVKRSGVFRPQMWLAWIVMVIGVGLLTTIKVNTSSGHMVAWLAIASVGMGILTSTTYFPVLAPLHVSQNGLALAFFTFTRNFAQVWGITIGGAVLQNELKRRVPADVLAQIPGAVAGSLQYALIPVIKDLPGPVRDDVRAAFAESLRIVWCVFVGIAALGLLSSIPMRGLPLHTSTDAKWALEERQKQADMKLEPTV